MLLSGCGAPSTPMCCLHTGCAGQGSGHSCASAQQLLCSVHLKATSTFRSAEVDLHQLKATTNCRLAAQMDALGGGGEVDPNMPLPEGVSGFMNDLMQSLLSKDVLYGSMKEIGDKYPQWLQDHRFVEVDLPLV